MKNLLKLKKVMVLALLIIIGTSCDNDDNAAAPPPVADNTITGIASSNADFSILVEALTKADLATTLKGVGPFTVFAPTNAAFTAFLKTTPYASIKDVPTSALTQILLNHVVTGKVKSTDLTTGYIKTLAKGGASTTNNLSMYVNISSGVKLNGVAKVVTPDIMASNGVIHVVNAVLLPKS